MGEYQLKISKETDLQKRLVDTCTDMGGFGFKLQDKYVKGKPDVWLKLPSGVMLFSEVKIIRNARYTLSPVFQPLQLERMEALEMCGVPCIGLVFAQSPEGAVDFKICPLRELLQLKAKFGNPRYHISHFRRAHNLGEVIEALEVCFAGSLVQYTPPLAIISDLQFFPATTLTDLTK